MTAGVLTEKAVFIDLPLAQRYISALNGWLPTELSYRKGSVFLRWLQPCCDPTGIWQVGSKPAESSDLGTIHLCFSRDPVSKIRCWRRLGLNPGYCLYCHKTWHIFSYFPAATEACEAFHFERGFFLLSSSSSSRSIIALSSSSLQWGRLLTIWLLPDMLWSGCRLASLDPFTLPGVNFFSVMAQVARTSASKSLPALCLQSASPHCWQQIVNFMQIAVVKFSSSFENFVDTDSVARLLPNIKKLGD